MTEIAGLVIGGVGLAALFDAAVNAFERVESGKAYGRDYQDATLSLAALQLQLARWGSTVKIVEYVSQGTFSVPVASEKEAKFLGKLLGAIANTVQEAEDLEEIHELSETTEESPYNGSVTIEVLEKKFRTLTLERQKKSSFLNKARWVFHDKKVFQDRINTLTRHINSVVTLFSAERYQAQQATVAKLRATDAAELTKAAQVTEEPKDAAAALLKATANSDPQLREEIVKRDLRGEVWR